MKSATFSPGTLPWLARHELTLSWRDFQRMMTAGKPGRRNSALAFVSLAVLVIHLISYGVLKPVIDAGLKHDKALYAAIGGTLFLTLSLMASQAMELVTRVFYSRSDLDLMLASPVSPRKVFVVRIMSVAFATAMLSLLLFGPAINVLAVFHSPAWLLSYPVIIACSAVATGFSLLTTIVMFKSLGAKQTRLLAQILAAIVGAGFIIGIQIAAISSLGSLSRIAFLTSDTVTSKLPEPVSHWWLPVKAAMGDIGALSVTLGLSLAFFAAVIALFSGDFRETVISASGLGHAKTQHRTSKTSFREKSIAATLRHKEWKLLLRDHWLVSQTLMQLLYLAPPAFMLWQGFGEAGALAVVAIPVLVMAAGQLAGGLAWLAISGEDAPQLVATAPIPANAIIRAKIEAVLFAIVVLVAPILILLAWADFRLSLVAAAGITLSTISATMIQLWFRSQAKRSSFRRRQTSSKVATLSEAFSSILWAGATGLFATANVTAAVIISLLALLVLWIARGFRPRQDF